MKIKNPEISRIIKLIKKKNYNSDLNLKNKFFKIFRDERDIEIPYLLTRYSGQKNILEVGMSLSDLILTKVLILLKKINKTKLYGLDIIDINKTLKRFKGTNLKSNVTFIKGNAVNVKLKRKFELISVISTLEHIGLDKPIKNYNKDSGVFDRKKNYKKIRNNNQDILAIKNLSKYIKKNGKLILTVPFGSRKILYTKDSYNLYAYYREYDYPRLQKIIKYSKLSLANVQFYKFTKFGWSQLKNYKSYKNFNIKPYKSVNSVACLELIKKN